MKIAFLFSRWSIGNRSLNLFADNLNVSTRGMTGSELSLFRNAEIFSQSLQHDVSLFSVFVPGTKPDVYKGVKLYHIDEMNSVINSSFDVVISINEPDILRSIPSTCLRVVCQYLNDWSYVQPNFDQFVDLWTTPCEMLKSHLLSQLASLNPDKWKIVPLGCDPEIYKEVERIPYSIISISSCDRGSHLILQQFSTIKKAVPQATLKILYHMEGSESLENLEPSQTNIHPHSREIANRYRYISNSLRKLKFLGVEYVGSASRYQVSDMLSQSQVFIGPLSTISFSEGFSVSCCEALAAGCFPIIGDIDCLGSIYKDSGAIMIPSKVEDNLEEFTNAVIKGLTDDIYRSEVTSKCKEWSKQYTWEKSAKKLEQIILEHPKMRNK